LDMLTKLKSILHRIEDSAKSSQNSATVFMGGTELLTRLYTGQKMYVDTRDLSETPHLALDGYWEKDISHVFEEVVNVGDVVIDVGATYGYYAMIAGHRGAAKMFSIDPNPVYVNYITKNMTVNGLMSGSTVSQLAIGAKKDTLTLHTLKDDWASSTMQTIEEFDEHRTIPYEVEKSIEVEVVSLDGYAKDNGIDEAHVIKLDIEGMEEAAYPGMKKLVENSPDLTVFMEFSPENYKDAEVFYKELTNDFPYRYCMPAGTNLKEITTYSDLKKAMGPDWVMLVVSKKELPLSA